jgi:hypothetical protein
MAGESDPPIPDPMRPTRSTCGAINTSDTKILPLSPEHHQQNDDGNKMYELVRIVNARRVDVSRHSGEKKSYSPVPDVFRKAMMASQIIDL